MKILLATHNTGKANEVKSIFNKYDVITMGDIGMHLDIDETGKTFEENALIKAQTVYVYFIYLEKQKVI